ncbi:MAG: hypothetical protein LT071_12980 [Nocardioides sp.]|nr:hypothetical protein [Nocardioides sp.]
MLVLLRAVAALALVLVGVGSVPAPASAAYCSGSGVHVVVDFGALGGGVRTGCYSTSASTYADDAFQGAGFALSWSTGYPGVVCRVEGVPESEPCTDMPPGNAYWGLFEAHGGGWQYSQRAVTGVRLDPGDSVAFAWQDGGNTDAPSTAPGPATQTSSPTPQPTASPTKTPTKAPTGPSGTGSSTKPSAPATPLAVESPSDSAPSDQVEASPAAAQAPDDRLPAAVTWGVFGLLGAALATSAVLARRRRAG